MKYKGFEIVPIKFYEPHFFDGRNVYSGFQILYGEKYKNAGEIAGPEGFWCLNEIDAKYAVDFLLEANFDPDIFWALSANYRYQLVYQKNPDAFHTVVVTVVDLDPLEDGKFIAVTYEDIDGARSIPRARFPKTWDIKVGFQFKAHAGMSEIGYFREMEQENGLQHLDDYS